MDHKFWRDVYKAAKPWVLIVIAIGLILMIYLHKENTRSFLNSTFFSMMTSNLINAFMISLALRFWDAKKFPITWNRLLSLFIFSYMIYNLLKNRI